MPDGDAVLITEHRYTRKYDQTAVSGRYCVQFMTFKNNPDGRGVLKWWQDRCLEWCFARSEDGKFGDQKYLDHWPRLFSGIHELAHLGGGVAPWNVQQYDLFREGSGIFLREKTGGRKVPLVFYHFHRLNFMTRSIAVLGSYDLSRDAKVYIYKPYLCHLKQLRLSLEAGGLLRPPTRQGKVPEDYWNGFKGLIKSRYNIVAVRSRS